MPLALRILAGVGALAFLLVGVNILVVGIQVLLQPRPAPVLEGGPKA